MATVDEVTPDSKTISLPNSRKVSRLEKQALETKTKATEIKVTSTLTYTAATEFVLAIKEREKIVSELYDPHCANAHKAHKDLTTARGNLLKPLVEARQIVERQLSDWTREQTRLAQEQAQRDADTEQARLLKNAKRRKDTEAVEELKANPVVAAPVDMPVPKVSGIIAKAVVKFEIVDADKVPRKFMVVDESAIKAYIKIHGMNGDISGVRIYEDVQTQVRG